jgi:hypothetical protein
VRGDPEWELCIRCEGPPAGTHWVDDDERAELALVRWDDAVQLALDVNGEGDGDRARPSGAQPRVEFDRLR